MSASQYRSQLERKQGQKADAERKVGSYRTKEASERSSASKDRTAAARSSSASTKASREKSAQRHDSAADKAATEAAAWSRKVGSLAKDVADLHAKIAKAEQSEARSAEQKRLREVRTSSRRHSSELQQVQRRVSDNEEALATAIRELKPPAVEKLRILILGASAEGDLRVGREQKRIRTAVQASLHRDYVELDVRPAATVDDLMDGILGFRPHIVHFSGHSDATLITFEDEVDDYHEGVVVSASAFGSAMTATDSPPALVLLNSCDSAAQIDGLTANLIGFAIGMSDEIEDGDAIAYSAQFYAAIANGHSIQAAHDAACARMELLGLSGSDLPVLSVADGKDPRDAILVMPPQSSEGPHPVTG